MHFSHVAHAQAVRDRQEAIRRNAEATRHHARPARAPLGHRLRCLAARLGGPAVASNPCGPRAEASVAGSR